jgi:hypothetical protein
MATALASLTVAQQEFADVHAVGLVEASFELGKVFMYHDDAAFTDRWLVRADGSAAQHDRFARA